MGRTSNKVDSEPITLESIKESIKLLKPIKHTRMRVGKKLYKKLGNSKLFKTFKVGSLYGIDVYMDNTLKPNEYRFE